MHNNHLLHLFLIKKRIFLLLVFLTLNCALAKEFQNPPEEQPLDSVSQTQSHQDQKQEEINTQNTSLSNLSSNTPPPQPSPKNKNSFQFIYAIDFDFILDNLEESSPYWPTRTLFAGSAAPQVGFKFYGQQLVIGGYFIQNMGEKYPSSGSFTISYDFKYNALRGYFGIFQKNKWIGEYSNLFYRKDFLFFNPVNSGVLFQYDPSDHNLQAELLFDWYGGNLAKRTDEFLTQGYLRKNFFDKALYLGGSFLLYHFKNDEFLNRDGHNYDTYLLDRFYYQFFIGSDLSAYVPYMDKLNFKLSTLGSLERKRRLSTGLDPFSNLYGGQFDFEAQYKGFGIENSFYFGTKQYKYFKEYGEDFYVGLPFYQSSLYNRSEIYYEYKNDYLVGRISFIFHSAKDVFSYQQMLTLSLDTHKLFGVLFR